MKLTTKTDYCLRVLIYLLQKGEKAKIQEIADYYQISKNHLSVAVNKLSELGHVISTPGPKGGIELSNKALSKTVGDLVRAVEDFTVVECFDPKTNTCNLNPHCRLKGMISQAKKAFLDELDAYQISDLT